MIVLTPHQKYRFTTRDGSPSDEAVVRETWVENVYQIHESDLADTGILVDIGANIGAVSVYAASLGATVVAYEPGSDNLTCLSKNLADNGVADRVQVHRAAVGLERGAAMIVTDQGQGPLHGNSWIDKLEVGYPGWEEVPMVTLDDVFADNNIEQCDVLKMDIEGSEFDVIRAASIETLWRIKYLTLEFDGVGEGWFGGMVEKLAHVFNLHIIGSPERGGYIYGRRY